MKIHSLQCSKILFLYYLLYMRISGFQRVAGGTLMSLTLLYSDTFHLMLESVHSCKYFMILHICIIWDEGFYKIQKMFLFLFFKNRIMIIKFKVIFTFWKFLINCLAY